MTVLLVGAVIAFVAAVVLAGAEVVRPRRELRVALDRVSLYGGTGPVDLSRRPLFDSLRSAARSIGTRAGRRADLDAVAARLAAAGLAERVTAEAYVALKLGAAAVGALLGILLGLLGGSPARALVAGAAFALAALLAPDRVVAYRAARRREEIRSSLPDALDLLAVSVEAGLGLDAAIAKVSEATRGPLADEFALMLGEIRLGTGRNEALERLAQRVAVPEVTTFARAVARADKLGTSLARTLRFHAVETRFRWQMAAEEAAGKAPVKMLFPTVLLIFPALFVVVLGPALIMLKEMF